MFLITFSGLALGDAGNFYWVFLGGLRKFGWISSIFMIFQFSIFCLSLSHSVHLSLAFLFHLILSRVLNLSLSLSHVHNFTLFLISHPHSLSLYLSHFLCLPLSLQISKKKIKNLENFVKSISSYQFSRITQKFKTKKPSSKVNKSIARKMSHPNH